MNKILLYPKIKVPKQSLLITAIIIVIITIIITMIIFIYVTWKHTNSIAKKS